VRPDQIHQKCEYGKKILGDHKNLVNVLQLVYPSHKWKKTIFKRSSSQLALFDLVKQLFPVFQHEIQNNFWHPQITTDNGQKLQLDIFIPSLQLAIEYNGNQHYSEVAIYKGTKGIQTRDVHKIGACKQAGITLVIVPYQCTVDIAALKSVIQQSRPDIHEKYLSNYEENKK